MFTYPCMYNTRRDCNTDNSPKFQDRPFYFPMVNPDCGLKIKKPQRQFEYSKTCNGV